MFLGKGGDGSDGNKCLNDKSDGRAQIEGDGCGGVDGENESGGGDVIIGMKCGNVEGEGQLSPLVYSPPNHFLLLLLMMMVRDSHMPL